MTKELSTNQYDLSAPAKMTALANLVKAHVLKQGLYSEIQGKKYVHVEGWQFAGGQMGVYPRVVAVTNISTATEKKWQAEVELVRFKDDKVVSRGFGICSNAEGKKRSFDEYAVLSMAQTRAIGKAYRNLIGWVMKLGGFEATPKEEMGKMGAPDKENLVQVNVDAGTVGIQPELDEILTILKEFGFDSQAKQFAGIKRLTGIILTDWRMTSSQARTIYSALLQKKLEKKK